MSNYSDKEVKDLVKKTFRDIFNSTTKECLLKIENNPKFNKNRIDTDKYPQLGFSITPTEIQQLQDDRILDEEGNLTEFLYDKINDPLTKLLFSMSWKQGNLVKISTIVKGVMDSDSLKMNSDKGLVFHQFGKYLTKTNNHPIIDQHVIRSFLVYQNLENDITSFRKLSILNKKHKNIINQYVQWINSNSILVEIKQIDNYQYYIDRILFGLGKTIKSK